MPAVMTLAECRRPVTSILPSLHDVKLTTRRFLPVRLRDSLFHIHLMFAQI
jgi:hypothetical protein